MQAFTLGLIQHAPFWEEKEKNIMLFEEVIEALSPDCSLVLLPEMFNTGFSMNVEKCAEGMNGESIEWMKNTCVKKGISLAGTLIIRKEDSFFNRLVVCNEKGELSHYDKRHLFAHGEEDKHFNKGEKELIFEHRGWKIKALTCYDLRFPVWAKNRYKEGKYAYDVLIYLANWPASRIQVWRKLLMARALENQVFCAGLNRTGMDGRQLEYNGQSLCVDPKGDVMLDADDRNGAFEITLDPLVLAEFRENFPLGPDWDDFCIKY